MRQILSDEFLAQTEAKYGLWPGILGPMIQHESSWNPRNVSRKGAQGLMQIIPSTAKMLGLKNPMDPMQNVDAGARYLGMLKSEFGTMPVTLAAYNAGEGAVRKHGGKIPPYRETQAYVPAIVSAWEKARAKTKQPQIPGLAQPLEPLGEIGLVPPRQTAATALPEIPGVASPVPRLGVGEGAPISDIPEWNILARRPKFADLSDGEQVGVAANYYEMKLAPALREIGLSDDQLYDGKRAFIDSVKPMLKISKVRDPRVDAMSPIEHFATGAGAELGQIGLGLVENFARQASKGIDKPFLSGEDVAEFAARLRARNQPIMETTGGAIGSVIPATVATAGIQRAIPIGVVSGAIEAAKPGPNRFGRAALAGVGGALGAKVAEKLVSPFRSQLPPGRLPILQAAQREGFRFGPEAWTANKVAQATATGLKVLPGSAGPLGEMAQANERLLTRKVAEEFISPRMAYRMGVSGPIDVLDGRVLNEAKKLIGKDINNIIEQFPLIFVGEESVDKLVSLYDTETLNVVKKAGSNLGKVIERIYDEFKVGAVSNKWYKTNRDALSSYARSKAKTKPYESMVAYRVIDVLDDAVEKFLPDTPGPGLSGKSFRGQYRDARRRYWGFLVADNAVDDAGNVVPHKLQASLNKYQGQGASKQAEGRFAELSKMATAIKDQIGSSGTAERGGYMQGIRAAGADAAIIAAGAAPGTFSGDDPNWVAATIGAAVAPAIIARAGWSPLGARYFANQAAYRGSRHAANTLAEIMRGVGTGAGYYTGRELGEGQ